MAYTLVYPVGTRTGTVSFGPNPFPAGKSIINVRLVETDFDNPSKTINFRLKFRFTRNGVKVWEDGPAGTWVGGVNNKSGVRQYLYSYQPQATDYPDQYEADIIITGTVNFGFEVEIL
jgi:hypothetical protein